MKHALPFSVCVPFLLLASALPGGELRFSVQEKSKLAKVFDGKVRFKSTSIKMRVDGEEVPSPMSELTVHIEDDVHLEVQDEYGALKDGKPKSLKRTFEKVEGRVAQRFELPEGASWKAPEDKEQARASELEGKVVLFTLGEDGEYETAFEEGKGEKKLLEKLEEDMDLRALLPGRELEVGGEFEIDVGEFYSVLHVPGGKLKLKTEDEPEDDGKLGEEMQANAKGKAKGTYKGVREVDGRKYAVVALECEVGSQGSKDDSERTPPGGVTEIEVEFDVEGELLWDVEAGHFKSCKLEGKSKMTMKGSRKVEQNGESHAIERITEFEGECEFSCTVGG